MLPTQTGPMRRFLRCNIVGAIGVAVKFSLLGLLHLVGDFGQLVATAVAVEANILHNSAWHTIWTWREQCVRITWQRALVRLVRFQCASGAVT